MWHRQGTPPGMFRANDFDAVMTGQFRIMDRLVQPPFQSLRETNGRPTLLL